MTELPDIAALAAARAAPHRNGGSESFYGDKKVLGEAGISAEAYFARTFGFPYSYDQATQQPAGDGGVDFRVHLEGEEHPRSIDVKGATKSPFSLLIKEKQLLWHPPADIYVCIGLHRAQPFFVGWALGRDVADMPLVYFKKYGPGSECRKRKAEDLRSMTALCNLFARRIDLRYAGPQ